ncbi:MAG TPA: hypothetical protein PKA20_08490 [Burkholderiaceae bacterium]|nr:hypothetical protein [Burkholderiaceae bacterium]
MSWLIILGLIWIACDIIVVLFFVGLTLQEVRADRRPREQRHGSAAEAAGDRPVQRDARPRRETNAGRPASRNAANRPLNHQRAGAARPVAGI